jgi:predicted RNA-binding Zn-ribbon protein involved in translation (DUF1610 family)
VSVYDGRIFALCSPLGVGIVHGMTPRRKINLEKIRAGLNTPCPKCGHLITPAEIKRITWDEIECPKCGEHFDPAVSRQSRKAQEG